MALPSQASRPRVRPIAWGDRGVCAASRVPVTTLPAMTTVITPEREKAKLVSMKLKLIAAPSQNSPASKKLAAHVERLDGRLMNGTEESGDARAAATLTAASLTADSRSRQ